MKTPDEIKKCLEYCRKAQPCVECGYDNRDFPHCVKRLLGDAIEGFNLLETSYSQVSKALCSKENASLEEVLQEVSQVKFRLAQAEREKDALMNDLQTAIYRGRSFNLDCEFCKDKDKPVCEACKWEWRGVCPDNTKGDAEC